MPRPQFSIRTLLPMTQEEIERCWNDPHNRKWGIYYCKADPRVIVPKHWKGMGWTLNFARPTAILVLSCMIALLVMPVLIAIASGGGTAVIFFTEVASILVVCVLSAFLASTKRWSR